MILLYGLTHRDYSSSDGEPYRTLLASFSSQEKADTYIKSSKYTEPEVVDLTSKNISWQVPTSFKRRFRVGSLLSGYDDYLLEYSEDNILDPEPLGPSKDLIDHFETRPSEEGESWKTLYVVLKSGKEVAYQSTYLGDKIDPAQRLNTLYGIKYKK
jgi:hypothetical protein